MKTQHLVMILSATFTAAWLAAAQDATNAPATNEPATNEPATNEPATTEPATNAADTNAPPEAANTEQPAATPADTEPAPTNGLVLNFHDVPLNAVLNYLSAKAGLIVVSDVDLKGKVTVVAQQPIGTNDIVQLLNDQLGKNNYAAVLQGRTLNIMEAERAKTYALTPVRVATVYSNIYPDDQIVTEIIPLHTLSAPQLVKDLQELMPRGATVTANESGNAIIMTSQQKDIRRIDEIINDLDGSALSEVKVFPLRYADAKSVAAELKEVFQSQDSDVTRAATRNNFRGRGGFGGGPMGFGGMGGGGSSDESSKNVQTHAVFVSDDQLNAVVASAPPDYMHMINEVITNLDQASQEITVMRVFFLRHADPGEISDELTAMFPSSNTSADQNNRSMGFRFGPFMQQQSAANSKSDRMKRETTVTAVADRRTQGVIVTASKDMMEQIEGVITKLDEGTQGVQKVTALDFGGADPATVEQTLAGLFSSANSRTPNSTQTATPLANRYTGNANNQTTTAQSSSTSGNGMGTTPIR